MTKKMIVAVGALGSKRVPIRQKKRKKRAKRKSRNLNKPKGLTCVKGARAQTTLSPS